MTPAEQQAIDEYNQRQSFLEPFRRITETWGVETQHQFQSRIRAIDLVADGDLESEWNVKVIARDTGVVVASFGFNEYGRYSDMRRVDKSDRIPPENLEKWVRSKIEKGQIRYSSLAQRLGVSFSDPRVIHDLTYRMARSEQFAPKKRRRWYNKGKEASINELYDQLQEAMLAIVSQGIKSEFKSASLS